MVDQQIAPWEQANSTAPWENQAPVSPKSVQPNPPLGSFLGDFVNKVLPETLLGKALRHVPETLPAIGAAVTPEFGGAPGAALGSLGGIELRNEFPSIFGQPPQTPGGMAANVGIDALAQGPIAKKMGEMLSLEGLKNTAATLLGSRLFKNFPAFKEGAAKAITQAGLSRYQYPETSLVESAAANAANTKDELVQAYKTARDTHLTSDTFAQNPGSVSPEMEQAMENHSNAFGKNTIGEKLVDLQKQFEAGEGVAGDQTYRNITKTFLSDVQHVRNLKLVAGPQISEQLALSDLVTNGFKESGGKIDASSLINKLGGPQKEIYEEAISPKSLNNFKDFLGQLQSQEKTGIMDKVVNYSKGHLIWTAGGALGALTGHEGFGGLGLGIGAASGAVTLTNAQIGKMMAEPQMAKLVVQAMKTPLNSPQAGLISKALTAGARAIGIETATQANNPQSNQD